MLSKTNKNTNVSAIARNLNIKAYSWPHKKFSKNGFNIFPNQ